MIVGIKVAEAAARLTSALQRLPSQLRSPATVFPGVIGHDLERGLAVAPEAGQ